jgi:hypothetical protein
MYDWAIHAVQTRPNLECPQCQAPLDLIVYLTWGGGDSLFPACTAHYQEGERERTVASWYGDVWELEARSWYPISDTHQWIEDTVEVPGDWCRWAGEDVGAR